MSRSLSYCFLLISLIFPGFSIGFVTGNPILAVAYATQGTIYHPRPPSTLHWHPCQNGRIGTDCALLTVPLDYAHPHNGTITIGITRIKALNPKQRIGTLFLNAGGPGADGDEGIGMVGGGIDPAAINTMYNASVVHAVFDDFAQIRQHFDLIGFDPRGVGHSTKLLCPDEGDDIILAPIPNNLQEYTTVGHDNFSRAVACKYQTNALVHHIDTLSAIQDIDSIRKALGESTISYYGISYGTIIGQLYAEKYPTRLRATVLDGNINHSENTWTAIDNSAKQLENMLDYLNQLCRNDSVCNAPGKNVKKDLINLVTSAENGQLKTNTGQIIPPELITATLNFALYSPDKTTLIPTLDALFARNQKTLANLKKNLHTYPFSLSYTMAVACQDLFKSPSSYAQYHNNLIKLKSIAPHVYHNLILLRFATACINWPVPAQNPPSPLHIPPTLSILLVANEIDPVTPMEESISLHRDIPGSRLLITDAKGHAADGNSHCGRLAIARYLLTAKLPWFDEHCSG